MRATLKNIVYITTVRLSLLFQHADHHYIVSHLIFLLYLSWGDSCDLKPGSGVYIPQHRGFYFQLIETGFSNLGSVSKSRLLCFTQTKHNKYAPKKWTAQINFYLRFKTFYLRLLKGEECGLWRALRQHRLCDRPVTAPVWNTAGDRLHW